MSALDRSRSARPRATRAKTIDVHRISKAALAATAAAFPEDTRPLRPKTRAECRGGVRPCPFVSCIWHLYLDVRENGNITLNFPDLEVWEMPESCAMDVAERGGAVSRKLGASMNLTRERIRQIEGAARERLRRLPMFLEVAS